MTNAQRILLRLSQVRSRLNQIAGFEGDDFTDEIRSEAENLQNEYSDLEVRHQAAIVAEGEPQEAPIEDGEERELRSIRERVRLSEYVGAAVETRSVRGAEAEYNQALDMGADQFPLRLLAPETRATTDVDAGATQGRWVDRLFADTHAMHIGVTFDSVSPGVAAYPVTTAGASAAQRGRSEAAADAAWTIGVKEVKPTRNSVRAVFSREDAARLSGLEEAIQRDLRAALVEGIDRTIFLGDADANENSADITGLQSAANVVEKELTQAKKVKGPDTLKVFAELIDGKHASSPGDLRTCAAVGANTLWMSSLIGTGNSIEMTIAAFLRAAGLSWMVRGDIETATTAGKFGAFIGRNRGIAGAAVAPVWDAATLTRDPYGGAAKGEVALTLTHLWGFALPRATNFARIKFVV